MGSLGHRVVVIFPDENTRVGSREVQWHALTRFPGSNFNGRAIREGHRGKRSLRLDRGALPVIVVLELFEKRAERTGKASPSSPISTKADCMPGRTR